jgi:hypothetical protein
MCSKPSLEWIAFSICSKIRGQLHWILRQLILQKAWHHAARCAACSAVSHYKDRPRFMLHIKNRKSFQHTVCCTSKLQIKNASLIDPQADIYVNFKMERIQQVANWPVKCEGFHCKFFLFLDFDEFRSVGIHQCLSGLLLCKWACATLVLSFPQIIPFNPYSTYNCHSPNLCKCTLTAVRTSPFSKWTRNLDNGEFPPGWAGNQEPTRTTKKTHANVEKFLVFPFIFFLSLSLSSCTVPYMCAQYKQNWRPHAGG